MLDLAGDLASALLANYPEFPEGCRPVELAFVVDVLDVLVDRADVLLEELGQQRLRQPERLALEATLDARPAVLGLLEDETGAGLGGVGKGRGGRCHGPPWETGPIRSVRPMAPGPEPFGRSSGS